MNGSVVAWSCALETIDTSNMALPARAPPVSLGLIVGRPLVLASSATVPRACVAIVLLRRAVVVIVLLRRAVVVIVLLLHRRADLV
jgi:hypothetical protein